jgi:tripartite ATP-independent transporter DctM subunit
VRRIETLCRQAGAGRKEQLKGISMQILGILVIFFLFLLVGMPIVHAMGLVSLSVLGSHVEQLVILTARMMTALDNFIFLSIPLFIFASELMTQCNLMEALVHFCDVFIGHVKGGLALVNVLGSMLFAGVSGSASADTSGLGRVEIALMTKAGYDRTYSTTVTVASSILGPIIPPSNIFIIYAACTSSVSIAAMFLAGVLPGVFLGLVQMGLCYYFAVKYNHPVKAKTSLREKIQATYDALPVLVLPVIILGGIISGIFTATESAAIAVFYALIIAIARKKLNLKILYKCCLRAAKTTCSIMLIIAVAALMGYAMTLLRLPQLAIEWATTYIGNKYLFLLFVNALLLFLGSVLDQTPALLLVVPILLPIANKFQINPIHFGLVVCFNLTVGLITPPVGMQLFIGANVGNVKLSNLYKSILPFAAVSILTLFLITYVPWFTTILPKVAGYIR